MASTKKVAKVSSKVAKVASKATEPKATKVAKVAKGKPTAAPVVAEPKPGKPAPAVRMVVGYELSENQRAILRVLRDAKKGTKVTRNAMRDKTQIRKGMSKLLGAPTRGDTFGVQQRRGQGLELRGFVHSTATGPNGSLEYVITPEGRKAIGAPENK